MPAVGKSPFLVRKNLVKRMRHVIGVYGIFNVKDNRRPYVGSAAKSVGRRWGAHLDLLRINAHPNVYLQRAWNKYGEDAFVFELIEACEKAQCIAREQHWIDSLHAFGRGYNMCRKAGSRFGVKLSTETKQKIAAAQRGKKASTEARRKMSEARKGVMPTDQARARMAENHWSKGDKAEEISKRIAAGNAGRTYSEERRENISKGKVGHDVPDNEVVARYLSGESVNSLGTAFDVDNCVIRRKLVNNGVIPRNRKEAAINRRGYVAPRIKEGIPSQPDLFGD